MTKPIKKLTSTSELAKALAVLNGKVEPVPGVSPAMSSSLKPSSVKPVRHVAVSLAQGVFIAIELNCVQQPVLAKLFNLDSKSPLLASMGTHIPGSLSEQGKQIFIHAAGTSVKAGTHLGVELVFKDNTQLKFKLEVQTLQERTSLVLLELCGAGSNAFGNLLKQDSNKKSLLHKIAAHLIQFERSKAPKFTGKVDGVIGSVVEGWFWNPAQPKKRYEIQAWKGDRLVGYATANVWRDDLEKAGKDDGKVKFELRVSNLLNDGEAHTLQMKVLDPDTFQIFLDLGQPLRYQHLNKSFSQAVRPRVMHYAINIRMFNALLKKAKFGEQLGRIESEFSKIFMHLDALEFKQARELIERQMQAGFDNGFSRTKLAETYVLEQDYEKAAEIYRMVITKAKDFVWSYTGLGFVLERMGLKAEAIAAYQDALRISPAMNDVFEKVSQLQAELEMDSMANVLSPGLIESLIKHSQRAMIAHPDDYSLSEKIHGFEMTLKKMRGAVFPSSTLETSRSLALRRLRHARIYLQSCINHAK